MYYFSADNFEQDVLKSKEPVLVDFWATWCGPCRMIAPFVEELAEQLKGTVKVGKVNVDEEMSLAIKYRVEAIPTLILFKDGQPVKRNSGVMDKEEIISFFELK